MKIKDPKIKQFVEVADKNCVKLPCSCYWPRPDPGVFTQGKGYSQRKSGKKEWICGTREIHGCPYTNICPHCSTKHPQYKTKCQTCGQPLTNNPKNQ